MGTHSARRITMKLQYIGETLEMTGSLLVAWGEGVGRSAVLVAWAAESKGRVLVAWALPLRKGRQCKSDRCW